MLRRGEEPRRPCRVFLIRAHFGAFSDSGRWQERAAAGYWHRARGGQGHFDTWVCSLGSWGLFRRLSAVAGPAELFFS